MIGDTKNQISAQSADRLCWRGGANLMGHPVQPTGSAEMIAPPSTARYGGRMKLTPRSN